jgi:hypothetical protein
MLQFEKILNIIRSLQNKGGFSVTLTYAEAGVSISEGERFVRQIKKSVDRRSGKGF